MDGTVFGDGGYWGAFALRISDEMTEPPLTKITAGQDVFVLALTQSMTK